MTPSEALVGITREADVARALHHVRRLGAGAGFEPDDIALIGTAAAELVSNICKYAGHGTLTVRVLRERSRVGVELVARDRGPGITDVALALTDHHSTGGSLGLGLPGVRRLMSELEIASEPGVETTVTTRKWRDV